MVLKALMFVVFRNSQTVGNSIMKSQLPNIQTSLAEVNRRKFMDSGAIHLIGSFPLEAENTHYCLQTVSI